MSPRTTEPAAIVQLRPMCVPGSTVTFEVTAFNDFQPSTSVDQLFSADIQVLGDLVTVLDVRKVYVIVPKATVVPQ